MALAAPSFRKKKQKYPFLFCSLLTYSYLCNCMNPTNIDEPIVEYERPYEDDGSLLIAAESSWRGMAVELQELHYLRGAQFINQLKLIVIYGEFHPVEGETNIFSAISSQDADYDNLINAARKAVEHGYRVYILPNPRSCRTADFILRRKESSDSMI